MHHRTRLAVRHESRHQPYFRKNRRSIRQIRVYTRAYVTMNRRAAASIRAIRKALPFEPPGMLLLFIIFGSQVRNTQTPKSDLDILYVTRRESKQFYKAVEGAVLGARGGVKRASIFAYTPDTIKKYANLYGMVEYGALRGYHNGESIILYRSDTACDALDGMLPAGVGGCRGDEDGHNRKDVCDTAWCARRWLGRAENKMSEGLSSAEKHGVSDRDEAGFVCYMMYESIDCAVKACLLHHGIKFPFTRDIRILYGMLPPEDRMPMDFDALGHWSAYFDKRFERMLKKRAPPYDYTRNDVDAAVDAARKTHALVSEALDSAPRPANDRHVQDGGSGMAAAVSVAAAQT